MYRKFFFVAGIVLASSAQAQTPDRTIMRHIAVDYAVAGTPSGATNQAAEQTPVLRINGERALLRQVESPALLGVPSALPVDGADSERQSSFRAEVRAMSPALHGAKPSSGRSRTAIALRVPSSCRWGRTASRAPSCSPVEVELLSRWAAIASPSERTNQMRSWRWS